ncbi:M28 family metallopeptidase [Sphingomonas parapaucimobilis]|uniref:Peptidase M28 family protein n=1 Tax=Sphingomonas parapaucimobilis NBRC 15100 TaxID=1219049 RepID=A0A0A1W7X2_9SPHN|nr:M28 family metallopeptidase [Sphingomonas parapaucimobilis]GAM01231.1 peptidase M28 family protein [Sphingomonas parapaucimobilis NBRC 15100]
MSRMTALLPLLLLSTAAIAHDHDHLPYQTTGTAPVEAKATRSPAERNAVITAPLPEDQAAMKAHVMFLASDAMAGREAGTRDYDIAAQYVAAQFYAAGLRPGGDQGGYLQKVPLVAYNVADKGSALWTPAGGQAQELVFGEDFVPSPVPNAKETSLSAPVVFVGYGIDAAQYGLTDYKGVDVRGKIVAFVPGTPAGLGGEERAFFGSAANKASLAAARGAVGAIQVDMPRAGGRQRPFASLARYYNAPRVTWANPDGTAHAMTPTTPVLGTLSQAGAAKLFGKGWDAVVKASAAPKPAYKPLTARGQLTVSSKTSFKPMDSSNIVGLIPGSDPKLKDEVVVLSAHLDHIGTNEGGEGDRINNGALDNAIGIASLIEEAKRFKAATPPKRTVLFLAVTAEEKGLVGSDYFANHPTVPLKSIVADVNLDMPILTYKFEDMVVFGADRSTLGPIVRKAVAAMDLPVSPDPMPEEGIFVRSDHFRFVQKGIPSVFLWPGQKGPGKAAVEDFMSHRYHRVGDEIDQGIDWSQGPRFVSVNYAIAREIADAPERPVWNKGDYFGTLYKGPMAGK